MNEKINKKEAISQEWLTDVVIKQKNDRMKETKLVRGKMKRKTITITAERVMKVERTAVDITAKTGEVKRWTDVINFLIDNYLQEAKQDMIKAQKK